MNTYEWSVAGVVYVGVMWILGGWCGRWLKALRERYQAGEHIVKEGWYGDPAAARQQHPRPIGRVAARGAARIEARRSEAAALVRDECPCDFCETERAKTLKFPAS